MNQCQSDGLIDTDHNQYYVTTETDMYGSADAGKMLRINMMANDTVCPGMMSPDDVR
jgi:hypothetical protein